MSGPDWSWLGEEINLVIPDAENLAGYMSGLVACQRSHEGGYFFRDQFFKPFHTLLLFRCFIRNGADHAGPGKRRDGIGAHTKLLHIQSYCLGHSYDAHFGSAVVDLPEVTDKAGC